MWSRLACPHRLHNSAKSSSCSSARRNRTCIPPDKCANPTLIMERGRVEDEPQSRFHRDSFAPKCCGWPRTTQPRSDFLCKAHRGRWKDEGATARISNGRYLEISFGKQRSFRTLAADHRPVAPPHEPEGRATLSSARRVRRSMFLHVSPMRGAVRGHRRPTHADRFRDAMRERPFGEFSSVPHSRCARSAHLRYRSSDYLNPRCDLWSRWDDR